MRWNEIYAVAHDISRGEIEVWLTGLTEIGGTVVASLSSTCFWWMRGALDLEDEGLKECGIINERGECWRRDGGEARTRAGREITLRAANEPRSVEWAM